VGEISRHVEKYCVLDYYSEISPDQFYIINSLYLDNPFRTLLRAKESQAAQRFSLRIRSYGAEPKPPFYFEIKEKNREFCRKKRARVTMPNWPDLFAAGTALTTLDPVSLNYIKDFLVLTESYGAEPVLLTQYRRKAYLSQIDEYARVTFDRDLRFQPSRDWSVSPNDALMQNYDQPEYFDQAGENVVLELKCERKVPLWFIDLIRKFDLIASGFSKFGSASLENDRFLLADFPFRDRMPAY
jgi:hypothetical protein